MTDDPPSLLVDGSSDGWQGSEVLLVRGHRHCISLYHGPDRHGHLLPPHHPHRHRPNHRGPVTTAHSSPAEDLSLGSLELVHVQYALRSQLSLGR